MTYTHFIGASTLAVIAASSGGALAQAPANPIEYCRTTTTTDEDRIACLEAALKASAVAPKAQKKELGAEQVEARQASRKAEELGAEQVAARDKDRPKEPPQRLEARIKDFDYDLRGNLIVTLENGQVWKQKDAERVRLSRKKTYDVEIREGVLSGYRMAIKGARRSVVVERLQ